MTAEKAVKVVVRDGLQVAYDGTVYLTGETVEVPEVLAQFWVRSEWVDQAQAKTTKGTRK